MLSYEETQELAESGAKVLNAQAVEFAKESGIAIYARATSSPLPSNDPSADGTVVRRDAPRAPGSVAGVASERGVLVPLRFDPVCRRFAMDVALGVYSTSLTRVGISKQLHVSGQSPGARALA